MALLVVSVLGIAACGRTVPTTAAGSPPAVGTISGTIRGPQIATITSGRMVEAVNLGTGERRRVRTTAAGVYTFELPAGTWRIEPSLGVGERLDSAPDPIPLEPGQLKTDVDVLLGGVRPRTRTPEGLAPPFA